MVHQSLQFTKKLLSQFIRNKMGLNDEHVILNYMVEQSGSMPKSNLNKVVISLINIEKETNRPFHVRQQKLTDGSFSDFNPAERYTLDLLISSNFDDYNETLKFFDIVLLFFQINSCIDISVSSPMPEGLTKLEFEFEKLSFHQMQGLWTAMGAKYQPSIVYKLKFVTIDVRQTQGIVAAVTNLETSAVL